MTKIAISDLDQRVCKSIANDRNGIISITGLLDNRKSTRADRAGMCTVVSFGERADFNRNCCGRLYQRRFNGGIEFFGHNQFLIESLDTSIMEVAGMAGNGRSCQPGGAA